jgi:hypothetical protein
MPRTRVDINELPPAFRDEFLHFDDRTLSDFRQAQRGQYAPLVRWLGAPAYDEMAHLNRFTGARRSALYDMLGEYL